MTAAARRAVTTYVVVALIALAALWAFVSYLQPAMTGERAAELLRCG